MPFIMDELQVQGEMDVDGGQPEIRLWVVVGGTLVDVVVMLQLVKPIGFNMLKEVPFEQVPPITFMFKSCGLSRMSHVKSQRFATQLIGSK